MSQPRSQTSKPTWAIIAVLAVFCCGCSFPSEVPSFAIGDRVRVSAANGSLDRGQTGVVVRTCRQGSQWLYVVYGNDKEVYVHGESLTMLLPMNRPELTAEAAE